MKLPSEKEAIELIRKHNNDDRTESLIAHSKAVAHFAQKTAEKLKKKSYNVNPHFIYIATLLHDIGKCRRPGPCHSIASGEILREEGYPKLAHSVERHGLSKECLEQEGKSGKNFVPKKLEEKIINFADSHFEHDKQISWKQRFPLLKKRWSTEHYKIAKKAHDRFTKNCKEIEQMIKS